MSYVGEAFEMMKLFYHLAADINYSPLPNSGATGDIAKESIPEILRIVFGISGSVALLIIVISGLRYILASGDPAKMAQAKRHTLCSYRSCDCALRLFYSYPRGKGLG